MSPDYKQPEYEEEEPPTVYLTESQFMTIRDVTSGKYIDFQIAKAGDRVVLVSECPIDIDRGLLDVGYLVLSVNNPMPFWVKVTKLRFEK